MGDIFSYKIIILKLGQFDIFFLFGMDGRLEGIINSIVSQGEFPPREMLEVASRPNANVTILFTDPMSKAPAIGRQLKEGDYPLMLAATYGNDSNGALVGGYFIARIVEAFKALTPELKEAFGEEVAQDVMGLPERANMSDEYFKAENKAQLVHGIKAVSQRTTHEENRDLEMLRVFASLKAADIMGSFLEGDFHWLVNWYVARLSALYANYSISAGSLKRTIDMLPVLAGRKFMGINADNINVIMPLDYPYLFVGDDLLASNNEKVSIKIHPESLLPLDYETGIMAFLMQNGIAPEGITSTDALLEFHNKKAKQVYQSIDEAVAKGAFSFVLSSPPFLGQYATGYDLGVLRTQVASNFSVDDIIALTEQAKGAKDAVNIAENIRDLAAKRGYAFPSNKQEAATIIETAKNPGYAS